MKTLPLFALFFVPWLASAGITVDELKLDCAATLKIVSTSNAYFNPFRPPHGRAPAFPASAGFAAKYEVVSAQPSCQLHVGSKLTGSAWIEPSNLAASQAAATAAVGKTIDTRLEQEFDLAYNEKYLPLYPKAHSETRWLSAPGYHADVPFSISHTYGIKPIEQLNDAEKLELATQTEHLIIPPFGSVGGGGFLGTENFQHFFLQLEPSSVAAKRSYAQLIVKLFSQVRESSPFTQFFDFHIGGIGSMNGAPFAVKLNSLTHVAGVLAPAEVLAIAERFPTLVLAGYQGDECLNLAPEQTEALVADLLASLPTQTELFKGRLRDVAATLSGGTHWMAHDCFAGENLTPATKSIALQLAEALAKQGV